VLPSVARLCSKDLPRVGPSIRQAGSTKRALKYRRGPGEIVIINHDGRGWWDPQSDAKGDVFNLAQHLDPSLNFGQVRRVLRGPVGIAPSYPTFSPERGDEDRQVQPPLARWHGRKRIYRGSPAWRYPSEKRCLPGCVLVAAAEADAIREGPWERDALIFRGATPAHTFPGRAALLLLIPQGI
jgi:hypothetical protein